MLTTLKPLLELAIRNNCAILAPDFATLAMAKAMIEKAEARQAPLILSYYMAFRQIAEVRSLECLIAIVRDEIEAVDIPICLHLDHGSSIEEIRAAIDAGFTSVMIDASLEPWEVNIERTAAVVEIAGQAGVPVESELGVISSGEDYYSGQIDDTEFFTDPGTALEFTKLTGIDALAVSIGNIHGRYKGEPKIEFERFTLLHQQVPVPLVLHGSSGISASDMQKAVKSGIRKVNLFTDVVEQMYTETAKILDDVKTDPIKVVSAQHSAIRKVIEKYIQLLHSEGTV